jgi:O-antigen/teichoic acid export membrane protein
MLFGTFVYAGGQWLQFAILARLGGPAIVGIYAFTLALVAPVMMLGNLQLRMLLASDTRGTYEFREYWYLRIATTVGAVSVIALIAEIAGGDVVPWSVLAPVCAMRAADSLSDVYQGLWQRHERMGVVAGWLFVNSVCSVAFMATGAALGLGLPGAVTGSALGSLAALAFVCLRTRIDRDMRRAATPSAVRVPWRRVRRLALEAAPLGVIILLGSLYQNIPRYFLHHIWGEASLGQFAAASQLTAVGTLVVAALGSAATPRLASLSTGGEDRSFRALILRLLLAGAMLGAAGVVVSAALGGQILALLFRPEFASGKPVLVILSVAAGVAFVATLLGYVLTSVRVIAQQPVVLAGTIAVLVVSCALLVPDHGGAGAAWSLVVASSFEALAYLVVLRRFLFRARPAPITRDPSAALDLVCDLTSSRCRHP